MGAGHHVVMACRSAERCAAAKADLDGRGLAGSCECVQLNLSDYSSVRHFVDMAFPPGCSGPGAGSSGSGSSSGQGQLDILVNNAALMAGEDLMRINHFSPFLLTRLLLPHMVAGGRVVNVASEAHHRGSLQLQADGSLGPQPQHWYRAYARWARAYFTACRHQLLTLRPAPQPLAEPS